MSRHNKIRALATLMDIPVYQHENCKTCDEYGYRWFITRDVEYDPYNGVTGLAQFAAILLKFPQWVDEFHTKTKQGMTTAFHQGWWHDLPPTQENILDEILSMNGVEV